MTDLKSDIPSTPKPDPKDKNALQNISLLWQPSKWNKWVQQFVTVGLYLLLFPLIFMLIYSLFPNSSSVVRDSTGGAIGLLASAAWLIKTTISNQLDKERYMFQTRFSQLYQDRAQAIKEIHDKFDELYYASLDLFRWLSFMKEKLNDVSDNSNFSDDDPFPNEQELDKQEAELWRRLHEWPNIVSEFDNTFRKNKIYLSSELCKRLDKAEEIVRGAHMEGMYDIIDDREAGKKVNLEVGLPSIDGDIKDFIEQDCLRLLEDLQQEFRKLLGGEM